MPTPTPGDVLIADLTAAGTSIVAHLAKEVTADLDGAFTLANFVECDFDGYAPITLTDWEDVDPTNPDVTQVVSAILHFEAGAHMVAPQRAVALYITQTKTGVDTRFVSMEVLDPPFTFYDEGDNLERQLRVADTVPAGAIAVD